MARLWRHARSAVGVVLMGVTLAPVGSGCGGAASPALESAADPGVAPRVMPPTRAARSWFLRARAAEHRGDLEEAERALRWLVREDGRRAVSHDHLASFYMRTLRWEDARASWERSLDRDPQRWQPHAALASIAKREGDAESERAHLERAVALRADAATHERLIAVQYEAGELDAARRTFDRWRPMRLDDPIVLFRRALWARKLERHAIAVDDLVASGSTGGRALDVAEMLVDSGRRSCRLGTVRAWFLETELDKALVREQARDVALELGDPVLLERVMDASASPPSLLRARSAHPPLLPLPEASDDDLALRAAALWLHHQRPERTLVLLDGRADPAATLVRALARVELQDSEDVLREVEALPDEAPFAAWAQVVRLAVGASSTDALQAFLTEHPGAAHDVALAAAALDRHDPVHVGIQIRTVRLRESSLPAPDDVVRLPTRAALPLDRVRTRAALLAAVEQGDHSRVDLLVEEWQERHPQREAPAALERLAAEPSTAYESLRALRVERPCDAEVMLHVSRFVPREDALDTLRRAGDAAPLHPGVQDALGRVGLGAR